MSVSMETVACNLCGHSLIQPELAAQDWLHGSGETFQLVRCCHCSLVYVNPRPDKEEIGKYYSQQNYYAYQHADADHAWIRPEHTTFAVRLTQAVGQPGSLLDIGCGDGSFLRAMRRQGWQVTGIEIHVPTANHLIAGGLNVLAGNLNELSLPCHAYDLITMLEVLEHVHDPVGTLRRAYHLLKPGGMIFLTTPNIDSLEYRLFKARWVALEPPIHLYHFMPRTLSGVLEQAGFIVDRVATTASVAGLTRSLWLLVRKKVEPGSPRYGGESDQHRSWRRTVHGLLNMVLTPVGLTLRAIGKGPGLEVFAHRA